MGDTLPAVFDRVVPYEVDLASPFRGLTTRQGVLVSGPAGWGEFAPFPDYSPEQDARWLAAAAESALDPPPTPVRTTIPVNGILADLPTDLISAAAVLAVRKYGFRTLKVKVGAGPDDAQRVAAVRRALDVELGPGVGRIRLDANGRWSVERALTELTGLAAYGIEYAEQPCRTADDLVALRKAGCPVRIAADESLRAERRVDDVADFADIAVIKVAPWGGTRAALELAASLPVPVVLSGALETSVGLARDLACAAALPGLDLACGLGTGTLLAQDVVAEPLLPRTGSITVRGVEPDEAALSSASARIGAGGPDWRSRLATAWESARRMGLVSRWA